MTQRRGVQVANVIIVCAMILWGMAAREGSPAFAADRVSHTDVARYLAGVQPEGGSPVAALANSGSWKSHAKSLDRTWETLDKRQLSKIRTWSKEHITTPRKSMLYMFGGPDFLYADTFFPNAETYVLAGLEPVGSEPDLVNMSASRRSNGLSNLRASMGHIVKLSYFITKDMNKKFHGRGFRGTLPLLYVFLARADKTIRDINYVQLKQDGTLTIVDAAPKNRPSGVRIVFSDKGEDARKTLYYFSIDLSNGSLKKTGFMKFMDNLGPADSFFKSASYLPHYSSFSVIREFILKRSERIVQDDTGFRLKHYDLKEWNVVPFGSYTRPIPIFKDRYQPAMARYFRKAKPPKLKFGLGYRVRAHRTSVLLATKIAD